VNLIVIPTFNRSSKLRRVLEWYQLEALRGRIVVLDASTDVLHQQANERASNAFASFVTYITTPTVPNIVQRLLNYLESVDDELVAIGNDEDAYLPEFIEHAFEFLGEHTEYVVMAGRYITSSRPLLGLRRISYWTDTFVGFDIDEADETSRVVNFQRLNTGGISPIYWSVRRRRAFVESCRLALRLRNGSAHELIDQITSCTLGKIRVSAQPMLLRDESKVKYVGYKDRDHGKLYIGADDLDEIEQIAQERWGPEITIAVRAVTSWYRAKQSGESYQSRLSSRSYCRFNATAGNAEMRSLAILARAIRWTSTAGILLSQVFAYAYYLKYMSHLGRGLAFLRMTKAINVNKVESRPS
jgi:glycosyltransferase domain-containing protein